VIAVLPQWLLEAMFKVLFAELVHALIEYLQDIVHATRR